MGNEKQFDQKVNEANIKLNQELNDADNIPFAFGGGEINSATGATINIQEPMEGKHSQDEVLPTYINNNTPAIKISGKNK